MTAANSYAQRRVMTVLAYPSPEDGSTGPGNFVTGVKSQGGGTVLFVDSPPFSSSFPSRANGGTMPLDGGGYATTQFLCNRTSGTRGGEWTVGDACGPCCF